MKEHPPKFFSFHSLYCQAAILSKIHFVTEIDVYVFRYRSNSRNQVWDIGTLCKFQLKQCTRPQKPNTNRTNGTNRRRQLSTFNTRNSRTLKGNERNLYSLQGKLCIMQKDASAVQRYGIIPAMKYLLRKSVGCVHRPATRLIVVLSTHNDNFEGGRPHPRYPPDPSDLLLFDRLSERCCCSQGRSWLIYTRFPQLFTCIPYIFNIRL